jgi:hypothetical protein
MSDIGGACREQREEATQHGERMGKCYIYGSLHVKAPQLERLLGEVDYVLIEGFNISSWRSLVKKDPRIIPVIISLLCTYVVLELTHHLARLWYKRVRGIEFKSDMDYIAASARKISAERPMVELVDANLKEIYEKELENFILLSKHCAIFLSVIIIIITSIVYIFCISLSIGIVTFIIWLIVGFLLCSKNFISKINYYRDLKVVERTCELMTAGYKVLIVRGRRHVNFIVRELRKRNIPCEVVSRDT